MSITALYIVATKALFFPSAQVPDSLSLISTPSKTHLLMQRL